MAASVNISVGYRVVGCTLIIINCEFSYFMNNQESLINIETNAWDVEGDGDEISITNEA